MYTLIEALKSQLTLIAGSGKLFQNCGGSYDEQAPMFRTGSGKSVEVKRSSVAKALSVLGDNGAVDSGGIELLS